MMITEQSHKTLGQRALIFATFAFAANFAVWTIYAVLGLKLQMSLQLSATELGLLFASPMLTGALARIPFGLLADHVNPKYLYVIQMLLVTPSLLLLSYANDYYSYLIIGLWLGVSGASFTIGIRYINDWFPREYQGTAMGIFGAANAGAAITLVLAPYIIEAMASHRLAPSTPQVCCAWHYYSCGGPRHLVPREVFVSNRSQSGSFFVCRSGASDSIIILSSAAFWR